MITPDVFGPTAWFFTFLMKTERNITFNFWISSLNETRTPAIIPDTAKQWTLETLVSDYEQKIADLPAKGFKRLASAKDSDMQIEMLSTKRMPRKKRVDALLAALNAKYKLVSTKRYPGASEDITVLMYGVLRSFDFLSNGSLGRFCSSNARLILIDAIVTRQCFFPARRTSR